MSFVIRVTHTGFYADGRPNNNSVFLKDLDFGFEYQNRKETVYIPANGVVDIPYTDKSAYSFVQGDIFKFTSAGVLVSELIIPGELNFNSTVIITAGTTALNTRFIQRYDASLLAPNALVLQFPLNPLFNDILGIKEVGNSAISIVLDGNGKNLEGIGAPPAATQNIAIALVSVSFKYDGNVWRII